MSAYPQDHGGLRARNKRTALLLLSVALVFGLGYVVKRLIFG